MLQGQPLMILGEAEEIGKQEFYKAGAKNLKKIRILGSYAVLWEL